MSETIDPGEPRREKRRPVLILTRTDTGRDRRRGVDEVVQAAAQLRLVPTLIHDARWELFGDAAGPQRNAWLVEAVNGVVAFWDLKSRGTADVIDKAATAGKLRKVYGPDGAEMPIETVREAVSRAIGPVRLDRTGYATDRPVYSGQHVSLARGNPPGASTRPRRSR